MTLDELRRYAKGARVGHKPGEQVRVHLDVEDLEALIEMAVAATRLYDEACCCEGCVKPETLEVYDRAGLSLVIIDEDVYQ